MQVPTIRMASQSFLMNPGTSPSNETKTNTTLCYEEKSVGSTAFYKCEACPYMALAEDDIKFHLFTVHPDLAKKIGLADNISIPCPGCSEIFDAENTVRTHLREHHKMGIRDVRKMVKSLIKIALNNKTELPKEKLAEKTYAPPPPVCHIPEVIEIVPDIVQSSCELPSGVTVISVEELQKMTTPNFEQVDPKEIIQEASINIVYVQTKSTAPDLLSSLQCSEVIHKSNDQLNTKSIPKAITKQSESITQVDLLKKKCERKIYRRKAGTKCTFENCGIRLTSEEKLSYHVSCHQNSKIVCPECKRSFTYAKELHTHLWKQHDIDMELYSCDMCNYKTISVSRLNNIHMKIHSKEKSVACALCGKMFKTLCQMNAHKLTHENRQENCSICLRTFSSAKQLKKHVIEVHDRRKPFQCGDCDFSASRKSSLKAHIRSHTGEESYKCKNCDFTTTDHNSLRRHKVQHTMQKKFSCKYCSYTSIQSYSYLKHMTTQHADKDSDDVFRCPYCKFISVNRDKLLSHLVAHNRDKDNVLHSNEKQSSWNAPNDNEPKSWNRPIENEPILNWNSTDAQSKTAWNSPNVDDSTTWNTSTDHELCEQPLKSDVTCNAQMINDGENENPTNLSVPIEVDDCDSEHDPSHYPVNYSYINNAAMPPETAFHIEETLTDLTKDDNNSDCIISESSDDTVNHRHQCFSQRSNVSSMHSSNLREFLGTTVTISDNLLQNNNINVITSSSYDNSNMTTSIMNNFPIYLPPNPQFSRRNLTLTPTDKIPLPVPKVIGPIIRSSQILPVPSSSNSPVSMSAISTQSLPMETDGLPKKKAKISVKSNLILKGPDQINMFNSEENMVFGRLEHNERINLSSPVTFNNLITTCMQLPPEPVLTNNPEDALGAISPYNPETMLGDPNIPQVKDNRLFTFNRQIDMNSLNMLSQEMPQNKMSIICGNPNFIKLESKQNIQSPSLEKMCNAEMIKTQEISDEYCKASPRLEDMQKNVNEIKNEIKSDTYFNVVMTSAQNSPSGMNPHLMDVVMGANEMYGAHLDLPGVVLPEIADDEGESDIIEIDDNSEDNKIIPQTYTINYPMDYIPNDYYFLESDLSQQCNNIPSISTETNEINKLTAEVPSVNQMKENATHKDSQNYEMFIHSRQDPMMNTSVRPLTNKINVKNIELMKK